MGRPVLRSCMKNARSIVGPFFKLDGNDLFLTIARLKNVIERQIPRSLHGDEVFAREDRKAARLDLGEVPDDLLVHHHKSVLGTRSLKSDGGHRRFRRGTREGNSDRGGRESCEAAMVPPRSLDRESGLGSQKTILHAHYVHSHSIVAGGLEEMS